jgi:hypothetical protein
MCGRPSGFKGSVCRKLVAGTSAVMCPALRCGNKTAAQMASASKPSTRLRRRHAPSDGPGCLARRFDRSPSSAVALSPSMASGSAHRLWPVSFAARHHGPHDTGHLVGQRHGGDLARPALHQSLQPGTALVLFRPDVSDHGGRAEHQQLAQAFIALARDAAQPRSAGGVLLRRQAEPGGEVPARAELPRIDRQRQRQGTDRANAI